MANNSNNPEVRFAGYTEDWVEKKAKELCSISTGKSNTQDNVKDGKYPFYVRSPIIERSNKFLFDEEAVLTVGDGVGTGKVYHYVKGKYDLHQRVYRMFDFKEVTGKYFYLFFSNNFHSRVKSMTAKSSVDSVRLEMIAEMNIKFPKLNEQTQIGNFFQNLDQLITQHQQKLTKLKFLKKAMLDKMFPKDDATVPEIRFKGFKKEWVKRDFGEILNYERPDNYIVKSDKYSDNYKTPVLTANKAFKLGFTNEKNTYNNKCIIFDDFTLESKYVDFPFMVKSSALKILTIKNEEVDNLSFTFYRLKTKKIEIMGHARHYIGVVQNTSVLMPEITEQSIIANYFKSLDKLIEKNSIQITKLLDIKKACLAKMFV